MIERIKSDGNEFLKRIQQIEQEIIKLTTEKLKLEGAVLEIRQLLDIAEK